jgi:subfamily B ATP-binding cassette protein MsbA
MTGTLDSKTLYLRLLGFVRPYWRTFLLSLVAMAALAFSEMGIAALLKPMLDGTFVDKDPDIIRLMPYALLGIALLRGLSTFGSDVGIAWVANKVVMDMRDAMFRKLVALPTSYYDHRSSGMIMSKLIYDVSNVAAAATNVLIAAVKDSLTVIGLLVWMIWLDWQLSLIAFIIIPSVAIIIRAISGRLRRLSHAQQHAMGQMTHVLEEAIKNHKVVKIFGGQEYESRRASKAFNWVRRYIMKLAVTSGINAIVVNLIAAVALATLMYIAGIRSMEGTLTVGSFVSFFGSMAMLLSPLKRMTKINEQLQKGLAAAESVFEVLDEPAERDQGTLRLEHPQGGIEIRNLTLRYPGSEDDALQELSLDIPAHQTIALVGASGSGKSSLVNLLPRLYEATDGEILIDGRNINDLSLRELRSHIALVSQEVVLFNDTVAANIAYGAMQGADEAAIEQAAETAYAMEFIRELPDGMQTMVGENGVRLSGGQRQRLAIARAVLKDAPILIFDEATSSLDTRSEQYVQQAMENLRRGRTTILIAHRLSTIRKADRIVTLHKGRIVEQGTHDELMALDGTYAQLYRIQYARERKAGA